MTLEAIGGKVQSEPLNRNFSYLDSRAEYAVQTAEIAKNAIDKKADRADVAVSFDKIKFIAHRGYSGLGPENGKHAFYFAGTKRGAFWGCETDLRFTADGEIVCMHDETIDRTTNGTGAVANMTLEQIRAFDIDLAVPASDPIDLNTTFADKKVPTLQEYLEIMNEINIVPVMELKADGDFEKFVRIVRQYGFESNCIVISFIPEFLEAVRQHSKKIKMMYLVNSLSMDEINRAISIENCGINMNYSILNPTNVSLVREHNLELGVWTVNNIADIENARKLGVDYITTNHGAGRFLNKEKRIALTTINNRLAVSQQFSSEYATLTWDATQQSVIVTYEYPFLAMAASLGTGAFISRHTATIQAGYEFYVRRELHDSLYLQVRKNGQVINPLSNLQDTIWVNILIPSY